MSKFLLILFFVAVGAGIYFNLPDSDAHRSGEAASRSEQTETEQIIDSIRKIFRSWRGSQTLDQPPDDGGWSVGDTVPDSDTSQCEIASTSEDKIITRFAGYILEYPCTAMHQGSWNVSFNTDGETVEQRYLLSFRLEINENEQIIWAKQRAQQVSPDAIVGRISLRSDGSPYSQDWLEQRFAKAEQIAVLEEENLTIFSDPPSLYGVITSEMNDNQNYAFVSCSWSGDIDPLKIFSREMKKESIELSCGAYWMLNDSIRIRWTLFDSSQAYRFSELYYFINPKLQEIVVGTYGVDNLQGGSSDNLYLYNQRATTDH